MVILDEPTLGLDPEGIEHMLQLIRDLSKNDGRTVLISSHLLHQVQRVCDRVGIFVKGRLLASGPIDTLADQVFGKDSYMLELKSDNQGEELTNLIDSIPGVLNCTAEGDKLIVKSRKDIRKELTGKMFEKGFSVLHLRLLDRELDDIFRKYFEKKEGLDARLNVQRVRSTVQ